MKSKETEVEKVECHHICTSNCRRQGCNCKCGEWHEYKEEAADDFTTGDPDYNAANQY